MSLFLNLLNTYEKCSKAVGISRPNSSGEIDERKTFLPIYHTTFSSQIEVTLNQNGNFIKINRDNSNQYIIIPCTEKSLSRTSGKVAHPLCDQLGYVDRKVDIEKYELYIVQLREWKGNNIKLNAIYTFLENQSILDKMIEYDLLKDSEKKDNSEPDIAKINKLGVRFSVEVPTDKFPSVWNDNELRELWIKYQTPEDSISSSEAYFDYLSGNMVKKIVSSHPKNINPFTANAKLISCNDPAGFTFRGRFNEQDEAVLIDVLSSQKVHQLLKWLIGNFSDRIGTQATIIWAVSQQVDDIIKPNGSSLELGQDLFSSLTEHKLDVDLLDEAAIAVDSNYAKKVALALRGLASAEKIKEHNKKIAIAIFDAATSGRMGLVFYQELEQDKYLENIASWHEDSAWHLIGFVKAKDNKGKDIQKRISYIGCPSFYDITNAIYGRARGGQDKGYEVIKKKIQKQLLECMFGNFPFPKNLVDMAAYRASNPMSFTDSEGSFNELDWRNSINITCSLMKKYIKQKHKEDISMELEQTRQDRDYLYGRLLAIADRLESYALYKGGRVERATNAIRLMGSFSAKPYSTWGILWNHLIPYIAQLQGAHYYQSIIDSIMVLFKEGEYENNNPLSPLYLLGYSAQNRAMSVKKEKMED